MDWPYTYHAWYVVLLTCSTNADFVGGRYSKVWDDWANICWGAWLTSDFCHSTRNRIQWNDEALDDSDVIWRRCYWLIHQMTKRGCELWPRAPFCVSRFLSRARKEGCVIWSCQGMELCLILWHVVMPPIARGHTWLYQPSPVSTVPNTGRNLSNGNYGGHDEEEDSGLFLGQDSVLHGPRTEKVAVLASASSFAGCASPCATRASSALDQRYAFVVVRVVRRDFCACTKMCAELDAWMYTPEGRQRCAERAGPTSDTRGAHAGYTLGMRCVFVDWGLAHT